MTNSRRLNWFVPWLLLTVAVVPDGCVASDPMPEMVADRLELALIEPLNAKLEVEPRASSRMLEIAEAIRGGDVLYLLDLECVQAFSRIVDASTPTQGETCSGAKIRVYQAAGMSYRHWVSINMCGDVLTLKGLRQLSPAQQSELGSAVRRCASSYRAHLYDWN